jgi:hypothetical protein
MEYAGMATTNVGPNNRNRLQKEKAQRPRQDTENQLRLKRA